MTANVKGPWRNYASCSAYNQTQGKTSTKMVVCFNPFLETSSGNPGRADEQLHELPWRSHRSSGQ